MNTMTNKPIPADGHAGERRAAAILGIALCANTQSTSIEEDAAKVDLRISFRHAFESNRLLTFHCQIKSGKSWKTKSSTKSNLKLNISKETIDALSGYPGIIVWVPPPPTRKLFWYAIDPRTKPVLPLMVPSHQFILPSLRYDLSRISKYASWTFATPRQDVTAKDLKDILPRAKKEYKLLCSATHINPLVGNLVVSRFAWRHVTKRSRTTVRRDASLRIVPYLKTFLNKCPDRYRLSDVNFRIEGKRTYETRYLLFWFRQALQVDGTKYFLIIRVKEEISYPSNWQDRPLSSRDVLQKATLASWWAKPEKRGA